MDYQDVRVAWAARPASLAASGRPPAGLFLFLLSSNDDATTTYLFFLLAGAGEAGMHPRPLRGRGQTVVNSYEIGWGLFKWNP